MDNPEGLLSEKRIPSSPWDSAAIENTLFSFALMDSNNFESKASIGEREGRCYSNVVARRHFYFTHGIGRSGDLCEVQPKATGSSVLYRVTNLLVNDFVCLCGFDSLKCILVPLSVEMSTMLCLLAFYSKRRDARHVFCFDVNEEVQNIVMNAGFNPVLFNIESLELEISKVGVKYINCLLINSNDAQTVEKLLVLNKKYGIPTVLYNVYSGYPVDLCGIVDTAHLIIYNDRHSILPIDATVICSYNPKMVEEFSRIYPGRATIGSTIDTFSSLLSLGRINIANIIEAPVKDDVDERISNETSFSKGVVARDSLDGLIPKLLLDKGFDALRARNNALRKLLDHGKIPDVGWNDMSIEYLLQNLSLGSSENIKKRHYNFVNGIDLSKNYDTHNSQHNKEVILTSLTNRLLQDLFKMMGIQERVECMILPVATGMSLVLSMLACHKLKQGSKFVIWSRIDQKSCFKSIVTAGFTPIIVDTKRNGDRLDFVTDTQTIEAKINEVGPEKIVCVVSVTSCFAPRSCDDIEEISRLCKTYGIFHVVNNAYGLTSKYLMNRIRRGKLKGNLDLFVQSTDKNLLVPVGGAIVACFNDSLFGALKLVCTGKVSVSTTLDVFITLMSMGKDGFKRLVEDRERMHECLWKNIGDIASRHGEKLIDSSENPISIALTLKSIRSEDLTSLGSSLFLKNVFGAKVVTSEDVKTVCNYKFLRWGSHSGECNFPYVACAAAVGVTRRDIDTFLSKLDRQMTDLKNKSFSST